MIGAVVTTLVGGQGPALAILPLVTGALSAWVAWGRRRGVPTGPGGGS